jgi:plastocyanin
MLARNLAGAVGRGRETEPGGLTLQNRSRAAFLAAFLIVLVLPAGASAATKTVGAGPPLAKPPAGVPPYADATQFFPAKATIHVGDTVKWQFFGFHTVYFPKKGGKNASLIAADPSKKYNDTDPAGNPFWFNGQTQLIANPAAAFPLGGKTENGTKPNGSGVGQSQKFTYKLKFTKAGTFTYYCTIHANMKATVRVLAKRAKVPSAAADKKSVAKEVASVLKEVKANNKRPDAAGAVVEAGRDTNRTSLLAFFPAKKTVPVGTTVDFRMSSHTEEIHTVTFGSDAVFAKNGYAEKLENALLAPLPGTGTKGPPELGMPGPVFFPSDKGPLSFDGTQHGGFLSAGLMGEAPLPTHDQVTFTKAGTFNFICLVHPEMKGQIVVQ